jgi:hypothetical protein
VIVNMHGRTTIKIIVQLSTCTERQHLKKNIIRLRQVVQIERECTYYVCRIFGS